jgi:PIN domain nuclease of toxin-antitoxin system
LGDAALTLLLDTHVWIWSQERSERLGRRTVKLLLAAEHVNAVCAISTLEIARLVAAGAIVLSMPLREWVEQSLAELAAETVPITHEVAMEAYALPGKFHRDPADRLLVAAARCHGLTLVTADDRIIGYREVRTLDARR